MIYFYLKVFFSAIAATSSMVLLKNSCFGLTHGCVIS